MRGQDCCGCSNHLMTGACSNGQGIRRTVIEERVLAGLKDRLMEPEAAGETMRAYAKETSHVGLGGCAGGRRTTAPASVSMRRSAPDSRRAS